MNHRFYFNGRYLGASPDKCFLYQHPARPIPEHERRRTIRVRDWRFSRNRQFFYSFRLGRAGKPITRKQALRLKELFWRDMARDLIVVRGILEVSTTNEHG